MKWEGTRIRGKSTLTLRVLFFKLRKPACDEYIYPKSVKVRRSAMRFCQLKCKKSLEGSSNYCKYISDHTHFNLIKTFFERKPIYLNQRKAMSNVDLYTMQIANVLQWAVSTISTGITSTVFGVSTGQ